MQNRLLTGRLRAVRKVWLRPWSISWSFAAVFPGLACEIWSKLLMRRLSIVLMLRFFLTVYSRLHLRSFDHCSCGHPSKGGPIVSTQQFGLKASLANAGSLD